MRMKQVWILVTLLVFQVWCCYSCLEEERIGLLQFKASIDHLYPDLPDWDEDGNCCNWTRVTCNSATGKIMELQLMSVTSGAGDWYLNASLFLPFKEIKILGLSQNYIAGVVENNGFERLLGLNSLEELDLNFNRFDASIIPSLSGLSSLKRLHLGFNNIHGLVNVEELNNLTALKLLNLQANGIRGFKSFQGQEGALKLKNLEFLYLDANPFDRSILSNLSGLSSLKDLDIGDTQIKGSMNATELNVLRNLEELSLNGNEIFDFMGSSGDKGMLQLTKLQSIDLRRNNFNNNIFPSLGDLWSLNSLYLGYNQLKGIINIKALDRLSNLEMLNLRGNNISKIMGSKGSNLKLIDLSDIELQGPIFDQDLQNFANVEILYMDYSSLDKDAFQSIGSLTSLRSLSMFSTTGTLPDEGLPSLKNLETLGLGWSNITNSFLILKTIGSMPSLTTLQLWNSGLSGTLSAEGLCHLKFLQELKMEDNDLHGRLPSCLANLTSLQVLDVSFNYLSGDISFSPLKSLTSIQHLGLSNNHFQIPISLFPFFNMTNLTSLYANDNEIYGEIEDHGFIPKFQLEVLDMSGHGHGHSESFPKFLYHQYALKSIDLSHRNIKGEFPHWLLDNNKKLLTLYLTNNSLSGSLQLPIHPHLILENLDISINFFHDQIPPTIASYFPRLSYLNMSGNHFSSGISSLMGHMDSLVCLDLSNNRLQGRIPEYFENTYFSLDTLILSNNRITGNIPTSLSNYSLLRMLDVSNNRLSGHILGWMGNMSLLEYLDLSQNNFSGVLSYDFNSPSLQFVYVSRNHLQGSLAKVFYNCPRLTTLDLSHNDFTGNIPERIVSYRHLN